MKPIKHPGEEIIDIRGSILNHVQGKLPNQVEYVRTIAGLALPVRCTIVQGFSMGSCSYSDFCKDIIQDQCKISPSNCPPEFSNYGIDCTCPFNIPPQTVDVEFSLELPDLIPDFGVLFFFGISAATSANGDFDLKINLNNSQNLHVACFRFLFTTMKT